MASIEVRVFCEEDRESPFNDWLALLKKKQNRGYKKSVFFVAALAMHGADLKMPLAKPLRDGIRGLRGRVGTVNYRPLYALISGGVAIISHGLTKEGEVPPAEIDLAIKRIALAKSDPKKFTVDLKL